MFSKKKNKQKTNEITLKGYETFSQYFNLTNKKLLFISKNKERTETYLSIFSTDNLSQCLAEQTRKGVYSLECIFPDGSFLIRNSANRTIIKICPETLKTISEKELIYDSLCALDNENFFSIASNRKLSKKKSGYTLNT